MDQPQERKPRKPYRRYDKVETMKQFLREIRKGRTLSDICSDDGMPTVMVIMKWVETDPKFAAAYHKAREIGFDTMAEMSLDLYKDPPRLPNGKVDFGHVAWLRAKTDHLMRLLGQWTKRYRQQAQVEHGGSVGLNVITGVPTLPEEVKPAEVLPPPAESLGVEIGVPKPVEADDVRNG